MRIGIIDLGTNSVRFDVQWIGTTRKVRLIHREKLMIRLGKGVFINQKLDPSAKRRTVEAFQRFKRTAARFRASRIIAFGTSALREATDADTLIDYIRRKTGIDIRVISGEEEAQLIALGILTNEKKLKGPYGLIDIGGGSTEVSICRNREILHSASFNLGTARLQQVFLKQSPPMGLLAGNQKAIQNLKNHIRNILNSKMNEEGWPQAPKMIGSSGTIRALDKILRKTSGPSGFLRKDLTKLVEQMSSMTQKELLQIPGMDPKRVDMILAGAILLEECMEALGATQLSITHYSLRDGILDREIQHLARQKAPGSQFELEELYQKAAKLGLSSKKLQLAVKSADSLFDKTKGVHGLHNDWKRYLAAAVILHDVGTSVSPTHYEVHSCYIAQHADFLAMEKWESEFIAQLCLKHTISKVTKKDLLGIDDKSKRPAFLKLLGLLRLNTALYQGERSPVQIKRVRKSSALVKVILGSRGLSELKLLSIDQKKGTFEEAFKCRLVIERDTN